MSFALNIGKNTKPEKPGFSHGPNLGFLVRKMAGLPGFGETRVYNPTIIDETNTMMKIGSYD